MSNILPLIYNPTAGGGCQRRVQKAITYMQELGAKVEALPTTAPGSATKLASQAVAVGARRIVAAGGDGTINEVINGLTGSNTELAIIPTGTANVLALELGVPVNTKNAAYLAVRGKSSCIDLGRAGDRYFALMAGIGFDALVIKNLNPLLKKSIRRAAFPVSGLVTFIQTDLPLISVSAPENKYAGYFVIVANSRYYGGRFGPAADASMTDGLLDICVLKGKSLNQMLKFWMAALRKSKLDKSQADYFRAEAVQLASPAREPVLVQTDGEVIGKLPMRVLVVPSALKVCAGKELD